MEYQVNSSCFDNLQTVREWRATLVDDFYSRDASYSVGIRYGAVSFCLSVCPSVCHKSVFY